MIFTILLKFFGKSCNEHMLYASRPNFEFVGLMAPSYLLFLELIQGAFWVQNGKKDGFTKMSVQS